jgi:hypothetical protein
MYAMTTTRGAIERRHHLNRLRFSAERVHDAGDKIPAYRQLVLEAKRCMDVELLGKIMGEMSGNILQAMGNEFTLTSVYDDG